MRFLAFSVISTYVVGRGWLYWSHSRGCDALSSLPPPSSSYDGAGGDLNASLSWFHIPHEAPIDAVLRECALFPFCATAMGDGRAPIAFGVPPHTALMPIHDAGMNTPLTRGI